jgi:pilus assembly protein CpaF
VSEPASRRPDEDLVERVRGRLARAGSLPTPAAVLDAVRQEGAVHGAARLRSVLTLLTAEIRGAGPLEPLLRDPEVTDVLVNGPDECWVDRGRGLQRVEVSFPDESAVRRLAQRLAAAGGRRVDDAAPYVDARLPDGTRLHAVLPPVASGGTCISLRVPRARPFTLSELEAARSLPAGGADLLAALVAARLAFLVSGGTGTGKTTLLAAMLAAVGPAERVVLVEEAAELLPPCQHLVRLEARPANVEGAGQVSLRDLVRQALRMRPDRIVVGEVRGAEVVDLLAAFNTGHDGGCATVHANGAEEVPARIEALGALAGLPRAALCSQPAAAVQVVLHLARGHDGRRRLTAVHVLSRAADGIVDTQLALEVSSVGDVAAGPAAGGLERLIRSRGVRPPALAGTR